MPRPIHIIVACAENRVIGRGGHLPWDIPEDAAWFREKTRGHTVVLGRRSWEDWPDAGEGRDVIVVTREAAVARTEERGRQRRWAAASLDAALALAERERTRGDIFICGGQRLYEEAIVRPEVERLWLTLVHAVVDGDTFFPEWRGQFPREVSRREGADERWRYTFLELAR